MLRVLVLLAIAAAIGAGTTVTASGGSAACQPTAGDVPGPFQRVDAPRRAKIGTGHVLTGRVLRAGDCAPVVRARAGDRRSRSARLARRRCGRGSILTDRSGRFRIEGPVPASSGLRPPHIHLAVIHPDYEELMTRYVVRRGAASGRMRIVLTPLL